MKQKTTLKEAVRFHGHLGPYLVLGCLAGETALKKLNCRKFFGLEVKVWGATQKPKSCLIDGLQLSTGATYGKGNIEKYDGKKLRVVFKNKDNNKRLRLDFKEDLIRRLESLKSHRDSEAFANELYRTDPVKIFNLISDN
jgi:formylmethanofuran dehydrogenase subunit E